jgi:hypothetical protein
VAEGGVGLSHRQVRVARAVAASSFATLVALASHVAAGGAGPSAMLVAAVCVLAWLPGIALIGRRPTLVRQAMTILVAEAALHATFTIAAAPSQSALVPRSGAAMAAMPGMAGPAPVGTMTAPSAAMWAAHAVAAVLTVIAWNRGEAAFWALVHLARRVRRRVLPAWHALVPSGAPRHAPAWIAAAPAFHLERVLPARPRRGPPLVPQR